MDWKLKRQRGVSIKTLLMRYRTLNIFSALPDTPGSVSVVVQHSSMKKKIEI